MNLALRFDDKFLKNIRLAKLQRTVSSSTLELDQNCSFRNGQNGSTTVYKNGQVRIYPHMSKKCLGLLEKKYSTVVFVIEVLEKGLTKYLKLQEKAYTKVDRRQILALVSHLKRLSQSKVLKEKGSMGIMEYLNPLMLFNLTTFSLSKKLALLQKWSIFFIFAGLLVTFEKGAPILMSTVHIAMLFSLINAIHLVNSSSGEGISHWLTLSNFNLKDTRLDLNQVQFRASGPSNPFYVPYQTGSNSVLYPEGVQKLTIY